VLEGERRVKKGAAGPGKQKYRPGSRSPGKWKS
jgi:hypothetical protein